MTNASLSVRLHERRHSDTFSTHLEQAVLASWTGRQRAAMEERLVELEALGIARPPTMPVFFRVAAARVTTSTRIEVVGDSTSGEVEFLLAQFRNQLWVGVGSDHTDRAVEAQSAAKAKQLCEKPICADFWSFEDVAPHWDQLVLRSFLVDENERKPYQEGVVSAMLPPRELITQWIGAEKLLTDGTLMFCGTLPTLGPIRASSCFKFELEDPVLGRRLSHGYDVKTLPHHVAPFGDRQSSAE